MREFQLNNDDFPGLGAAPSVKAPETASRKDERNCKKRKTRTSATSSDSKSSTESSTKPDTKPKNRPNTKRRYIAHDFQPLSQLPPTSQWINDVPLSRPEYQWESFPNFHSSGDKTIRRYSAAAPTRPKPSSFHNAGSELFPDVPKNRPNKGDPFFMSGAVSVQDDVTPVLCEDDNIDCISTKAPEQMPYKVIRREELLKMDLALEDQSAVNRLPQHFVTTYLGVQSALEEWTSSRIAFADDEYFEGFDWDQQMVEFIKFRGGYAPSRNQQVIYPEDIIPFHHAERDGTGWRWNGESKSHDEGYWLALKAQGAVWDTMPHIPVFP